MSPHAGSVSKMLVKAAADADGIVARMTATSREKQAFLGGLGRGLAKVFTRPAAGSPMGRPIPLKLAPNPSLPSPAPRSLPAPKPPRSAPTPLGPREFAPDRVAGAALGTAGVAGAGAIGYGHMQNAAENTVGRSMNPLTWTDPQSADQVFNRNKDKAQGMFDSHAKAQQEAIGRGDFDAAGTMADQMQSGEFGRSGWFGRNLNPFGSQESGKAYADRARSFQAGDPGKIEKLQANLKRFGPQMNPDQRASMQQQIEALNKHKAIQIPFGGAQKAAPSGGVGNWPEQRPASPGINPGATSPYDYRQHMYEASLQQGGQAGY